MSQDPTLLASLTPAQTLTLSALLRGATVTKAAAAAGVTRETVHRWLRDDPEFQAQWSQGKAELVGAVQAELRALATDAVRVLRDTLDPATDAPLALRLKAAQAVLSMVGADRPEEIGPTTPADAERANMDRDELDLQRDRMLGGVEALRQRSAMTRPPRSRAKARGSRFAPD